MAVNISKEMSDEVILQTLGKRLRERRIRLNLTQEVAATQAAVSVNTIKNIEKGTGYLSTFIAVLRVLDMLPQLNELITAQSVSPMMMLSLRGKPRLRARGSKNG